MRPYRWFVKGDLDGFFGLAVDNLVQVLVIIALCKQLCGFSDTLIFGRVLPGIAVSLVIGNLYYAWHARRVARRDGNWTCTALPYGINTPSVFAYILFILAPVYGRYAPELGAEAAGQLAWKLGLLACIGSGIIEFAGAFVGGWIRRVTPRAALLSALAAIGVIFVASPFAFQIFERPLVAMAPLFVVLIGYFARVRFPRGLPSGLVALILGAVLAWTVPLIPGLEPRMMSTDAVRASLDWVKFYQPTYFGQEIWEFFRTDQTLFWSFLGVVVPMGLINAVGSLQNIESAEAAGDRFSTGPCMAVNGIGSIAAGLFGSCFPTTIYIGHPGWKALGARAGYSTLNGLVITAICLTGTVGVVSAVIPLEAGIAIVLWIGIIITAQAFQTTPHDHAPAVAVGLFPAIAAWGATVMVGSLAQSGGKTLQELLRLAPPAEVNGFLVHGLLVMERGYIFTCMILAAVSAFLIERKFFAAAWWSLAAAAFTALGLMHAYQVFGPAGKPGNFVDYLFVFSEGVASAHRFRAFDIAAGYVLFAATFAAFGWYRRARRTDAG